MVKVNHSLVTGVRDMTVDDLPDIVIIETEAHSHPWRMTHFASSLASSHQCIVVEGESNILAYAITSTAAGEAELLNLTVNPKYHKQGIGRALLGGLYQSFSESIERFFLEVRESNEAAIHLYQVEGFNEVGRRPGYYPGTEEREAAIIMAKELLNDEAGLFSMFRRR